MTPELGFHELTDILRRRRGLILAVAAMGTALTIAGALLIPPRYTAKAQIIFEPQYAGRPGEPAPLVSPIAEDAVIATQVTTLVSAGHTGRVRAGLPDDPDFAAASAVQARQNLSAAARWRTAVGEGWQHVQSWLQGVLQAAQPEEASPAPPEVPRAASPRAASPRAGSSVPGEEEFQRHLRAFQEAGSHVIAVTYTADSPAMAAAIANRTIQLYIEDQSDQRRAATTRELAWLGERIPALKAEVDRLAAETRAYQAAHGFDGINPAATADQAADLLRQLAAAEADLAARSARISYLRDLRLDGPGAGASFDYLSSPVLAELHRQELAQMQVEAELSPMTGRGYPRLLQVRANLQDLRQRIIQESDRALRNLDNEAQIAGASVATLRRRLGTVQQAGLDMRLRDLKNDAAVKEQLHSTFVQRQEELRGQQNILRPDVRVLSRAAPPDRPSSPNPLLFVAPGLVVFLAGGAMLAVLADRLDRRVRSERDVMEALGIPCLALVPMLRRIGRVRPHQRLLAKPLGAYAEAIRSIVASLRLTAPPGGASGGPKVVLVSSSVPGEGKTTLAVSLATYVASLGRRVLLIDLDFRHSSIPRELGRKAGGAVAGTGVLDLLQRDRLPGEVIQHLPDLRLDYLPMARCPTDPFAPFASDQMRQLLDELRADYDCVVVDGPPLLVITEARLLASMVDRVVLVVKWGSTTRDMARSALGLLRHAGDPGGRELAPVPAALPGGNVAGAVVMQVNPRKHGRAYQDPASRYLGHYGLSLRS